MRAGGTLAQHNFAPAGLQVVLPEALPGAGAQMLMDAVEKRLARRMSLERAVDDPCEPVRQADLVGARSYLRSFCRHGL